jgi:hypothetical protein
MSSPATSPVDIEKDEQAGTGRTDSVSDELKTPRTHEYSLPGDRITSALGHKISDEEIERHRPRLRGARLTGCLAFVAGTGFTLFGYDQGVLSALLTAEKVCRVDSIFRLAYRLTKLVHVSSLKLSLQPAL